MSKNNFKTVSKKGKKGKNCPPPKEVATPTTFLEEVRQNNLCIFALSGECKNQCKGSKQHPTQEELPSLRILQKVMKTPWSLGEWKTSLPEIAKQIKALAYPEFANIRPFIRPCLYAAIGQDHCDNWRNHRLVDISINFNNQPVKIYACYTEATDYVDKRTQKHEKRAFCGLHFDFVVNVQGNSYRFQELLKTESPPPTKKELAIQEKKNALSKSSFPEMTSHVETKKEEETIWDQMTSNKNRENQLSVPQTIVVENVNSDLEEYVSLYNNLMKEYIDLSNKFSVLFNDYNEMKMEAEHWRKEADTLKFQCQFYRNPPPNPLTHMRQLREKHGLNESIYYSHFDEYDAKFDNMTSFFGSNNDDIEDTF